MMKKFIKFTIFFTFFLFIFSNTNVADARPLVAIEVGLTEVNVGEGFMVNIIITDEDIANMAGWNGSLLFDPAILSLQDTMVGDFIVPNTDFSYNDPTPGIVNMVEFGFSQSSVSGQGIIAVVNFIALKPGNTLIELSNFAFTDPDAEEILVDIGDNVTVSVVTEEAIPGDLDGDGDVDYDDYLLFRPCYGSCEGDANYMTGADLDGDNCVTINDYRILRTLM